MNYEDYIPVKIWSEMLEAGVPDLHVRYQVETHINALKALPDDTPDKQSALEHSKLFLSALNQQENLS